MPVSAPPTTSINQILPIEPLLMMGAGPTPLPASVAQANARIINHLGPTMNRILGELKAMGRYAFQTEAEHVVGISGPGSAAIEMAAANLLWPGRRLLALVTGTFSQRFADMATGVGADVTVMKTAPGQPATADMAREAFAQGNFDVVSLVQGETSTGVCNIEIPEIAQVAREHGALVVVDAVCTLTTMPLQMDDWGIDVVATGGQKGLACVPGVSLVAVSDRAWDVAMDRPRPMPHWCLDLARAWRFWGDHHYHYTAPTPGLLAMHEALRLICDETLEARFARHARCSSALQSAIEAMGLSLFVDKPHRLRSVLAINRPGDVAAGDLLARMSREFGVEIAGAFGLDIVRVGQMGEQCRGYNLFRTVNALGHSLRREGFPADVAAAMTALQAGLEG